MPISDFDTNVSTKADIWLLRSVGSCSLLFALIMFFRLGEFVLFGLFMSGFILLVAALFVIVLLGSAYRAIYKLDRLLLYFAGATFAYGIAFLAIIYSSIDPNVHFLSLPSLAYGVGCFALAQLMIPKSNYTNGEP